MWHPCSLFEQRKWFKNLTYAHSCTNIDFIRFCALEENYNEEKNAIELRNHTVSCLKISKFTDRKTCAIIVCSSFFFLSIELSSAIYITTVFFSFFVFPVFMNSSESTEMSSSTYFTGDVVARAHAHAKNTNCFVLFKYARFMVETIVRFWINCRWSTFKLRDLPMSVLVI